MEFILSATATLPVWVARQAEKLFHTKVYEIYGFAEVGSVATRRTIASNKWDLLDGVQISKSDDCCTVCADYLPAPVPFPDQISFTGPRAFVLHGRSADLVNVAGHRASLGTAFVVAPGKSAGHILDSLRATIPPALLPRPLYLVPRLPRNDVGKLTREALLELVLHMKGQSR
jgi:acyl-coenzyme A synthetase/AMP-(fatty) acid ligase